MKKISITAFTSIRSDFGLQEPLLKKMMADSDIELSLIVGGAHLVKELGETVKAVEESCLPIKARFNFLNWKEKETDLSHDMSVLLSQFSDYLKNNKPEIMLLYGDRYELLPLATACLIHNIPMAHISGGEITEGVIDNQVRHAVSKMANLHYPALDVYGKNLIKMGEESWRISVVGEPGLDFLNTIEYMTKKEFYESTGLKDDLGFILTTFHPETIDNKITIELLDKITDEVFDRYPGQLLITAANADDYGHKINVFFQNKVKNHDRLFFIESLGQRRYFSGMKYADLMLGNSSSGIVESQSFKLPVLNVGTRQEGRISNSNVLHSKADLESVMKVLPLALDPEFKKKIQNEKNIFGQGNSCDLIIKHLKENIYRKDILKKRTVFS